MDEIRIDQIRVNGRYRTDLGDIDALAASIEQDGLAQPVVLLPDKTLLAGQRRLEAKRRLGHETIPIVTWNGPTDPASLLRIELAENVCRKDFTIAERVAIGEALEKLMGNRQGQRTHKGDCPLVENVPQVAPGEKTRRVVAKAVGLGNETTYRQAKAIVQSRNEKLIGIVNRTGKVGGAYKILQQVEKAGQIAKEPPPLPTGPFRVIVVDPPWTYEKRAADVTHRPLCPYPTMTLEEIKAWPVGSLAEDDSILWLWTTNTHLPNAFAVVDAWGFTYQTLLTWKKDQFGTGEWLRGQTEHCLMCSRGKPTKLLTNQATIIEAPRREHSRKPQAFYDLVEKLCPGSKVELFAREKRDGWYYHGSEVAFQELGPDEAATCPECGGHEFDADGDCTGCWEPGVAKVEATAT